MAPSLKNLINKFYFYILSKFFFFSTAIQVQENGIYIHLSVANCRNIAYISTLNTFVALINCSRSDFTLQSEHAKNSRISVQAKLFFSLFPSFPIPFGVSAFSPRCTKNKGRLHGRLI